MISGILAVLTWKMMVYTVILLVLAARISHWKKKYTEASAQLISSNKQRETLEDTLVEVGKQVSVWQAKANAEAIKARAAQTDAAWIKSEYDAKVQAILAIPVTNSAAFDFLREQAQ